MGKNNPLGKTCDLSRIKHGDEHDNFHIYICSVRRRTSRDRAASISLQYGEWSAECKYDDNTEILAIKYTTIRQLSRLVRNK
jgi:hypothetical protein